MKFSITLLLIVSFLVILTSTAPVSSTCVDSNKVKSILLAAVTHDVGTDIVYDIGEAFDTGMSYSELYTVPCLQRDDTRFLFTFLLDAVGENVPGYSTIYADMGDIVDELYP